MILLKKLKKLDGNTSNIMVHVRVLTDHLYLELVAGQNSRLQICIGWWSSALAVWSIVDDVMQR